jgi:hypothetical protein
MGRTFYPAMATAALAVSVYAALVGTLVAAWRIYEWREDRKTQLEIFFGRLAHWRDKPVELEIIEVVNHSSHDVYVNAVGVAIHQPNETSAGRFQWTAPSHATIPGKIAARDRGFTYREHMPSNLPGVRLSAWATAATGADVESDPFPEDGLVTYHRFFSLLNLLKAE